MNVFFLRCFIAVIVASGTWGCSEFSNVQKKSERMRITSREDRWILENVFVTAKSKDLVELSLLPFDDDDYAQFKAALGLKDYSKFARGTVRLKLDSDGIIQNIEGSFDAQVGEHWKFFPEVQKVPTVRANKTLTTEIIRQLVRKNLL